jgi:hypothetical protein
MSSSARSTRGLRALRINRAVFGAALTAAGMLACEHALAADINWVRAPGNPGSFGDGVNWAGGMVPGPGDNGYINNGGIATAAASVTATINDLRVGFDPASSGSLTLTGGTINANGNMAFGSNMTGAGTLNISSGALNIGSGVVGDLSIGDDGAGTATISGGTITTRFAYLGKSTHGHGHVTQTGGVFNVSRNLVIAELKPPDISAIQTPSDYTMSGGMISVGSEMYIGAHGPSTFNLSGTGSISVVGTVHIAASGGFSDPPAGSGTLNMNSGTINVTGPNAFFVVADHGDGIFNFSGGTITTKFYNIGQNFEPGFSSRGLVNHTGGSATAEFAWVIGEESRSANLYDLSGGTVTVNGAGIAELPGDLNIASGAGSKGTLMVRGTGVANIGNSALVGNATFTTGTLMVSGNGSLALGLNGSGNGNLVVGIDGTGNLQIAGGSVSADGATLGQNVAGLGTGTQTGGTFVVRNNMSIGETSTAANVYNITAGTLSVNAGLFVGSNGTGTFAVGGTGRVTANTLTNALTGAGTVSVSGGTLTVSAFENHGLYTQTGGSASVGPVTSTGQLSVSGGSLTVASIAQGTVVISSSGKVIVTPNGSNSGLSVIGNLAVSGASNLDLNDNDMVVSSGMSQAAITTSIRTARNGGAWTGNGITSSSAKTQTNHATMLGVLNGAEYHSVAGAAATFDGVSVNNSDVLVKYTWYGDTDFNGKVNFDDYVRTDNGFNNHLSGWLNGDFDLNGQVNFDDYVLIDLAFNTQSGTLRRALTLLDGSDRSDAGISDPALQRTEQHFLQFGSDYAQHFLAAVPEPVTPAVCLAALGVTAVTRRHRRPV